METDCMDNMDLDVHHPGKAVKLIHSLTPGGQCVYAKFQVSLWFPIN